MMAPLPDTLWTILCLLLMAKKTTAQSGGGMQCSVSPVGTRHPVQALLERFEAGPGCAARESGEKETHVIAVGRAATNGPDDHQVTVVLKPVSPPASPGPHRACVLVLSSQQPVSWWLQAERLPPHLPVVVQVSLNSTVQSHTVHNLRVYSIPSLPFRPRALLRWALRHHANLTSLTHTDHANRVYIGLGEDTTLPRVCKLRSLFLSHNYLTSHLQTQDVHGCSAPTAARRDNDPHVHVKDQEVHVIKLLSAGSALCGSLQIEVVVSLMPPVANSGTHNVVLILSSAAPVNWAVTAHGVHGSIYVHSSNSVSPPYPAPSHLTLSSVLDADLSTTPDLLAWANQNGFPSPSSYTEAHLANRFVIRLAGGGAEEVLPPVGGEEVVEQEELRFRQWLNRGGGGGGGGGAGRGQDALTVQCEDGRLSVAVSQHHLQTLSVWVSAVTLEDPKCQARSNGSHFLLAFPVFSCRTTALLHPRGVLYKNTVLLWREQPQNILTHNQTERKAGPLAIHFSCLASVPLPPARPQPALQGPRLGQGPGPGPLLPPQGPRLGQGPGPGPLLPPQGPRLGQGPGPGPLLPQPSPRHRPGPPLLSLKLFVTEDYEHRPTGPCVITANRRVYVEVSVNRPVSGGVEVTSCVVSPFSHPRKSPFWTLVKDGCSSDPSLVLSSAGSRNKVEEEESDDAEPEEEDMEAGDSREKDSGNEDAPSGSRLQRRARAQARQAKDAPTAGTTARDNGRNQGRKVPAEEEKVALSLRFSFVLRPVFNDSVQFLHCSVRLCASGEAARRDRGTCDLHLPPLGSPGSSTQQCESRDLSRPMVVTQPSRPPPPPAGQRAKTPTVSQLANPSPEHNYWVLDTGPVMGIVFAAFALGISLMGALWFIYTHTGRRPPPIRKLSVLDGAEQSQGSHGNWIPPALMEYTSM